MGATYDLFGNGRTALKVTLNKYLEGMGTTGIGAAPTCPRAPNPIKPVEHARRLARGPTVEPTAESRRLHPAVRPAELRGQRRVRRCSTNAATFGTIGAGTNYDPDLLQRLGQALQQLGIHGERAARADATRVAERAVRASLVRELPCHGRPVVAAADYDRFTVNVPSDSPAAEQRRHGHGVRSDADGAARTQNLSSRAPTTTASMTEVFDGVNISMQARLQNGLLVQGGVGPGRVVTDDCDIVDDLPEMLHVDGGGDPEPHHD